LNDYAETIGLIERLHRRFLDVLRAELERLGISDINNVQGLLLANIGEEEASVGELMTRGYYLGSNVTYNLKRLVDAGYVAQQRSQRDRRVVRVRLSSKGLKLRANIATMLERQRADLDRHPALTPIAQLNSRLRSLEAFWADQLRGPKPRASVSALGDPAQQHAALSAGD
jgi:DNA-binding MarR family transcriptional regulator